MDKKYFERVEKELQYANSSLDDIKDMLEIPEQIKDFLFDLSLEDNIPKEIQDKASELWAKI